MSLPFLIFQANFDKAKKKGIHIVSVLWIEECRQKKCKVPEAMFPSVSMEKYEQTKIPGKLRVIMFLFSIIFIFILVPIRRLSKQNKLVICVQLTLIARLS